MAGWGSANRPKRVYGNTFFDQQHKTTQHDNKKKLLYHTNNNCFWECHVTEILLRQKRHKTINLLFGVVVAIKNYTKR